MVRPGKKKRALPADVEMEEVVSQKKSKKEEEEKSTVVQAGLPG